MALRTLPESRRTAAVVREVPTAAAAEAAEVRRGVDGRRAIGDGADRPCEAPPTLPRCTRADEAAAAAAVPASLLAAVESARRRAVSAFDTRRPLIADDAAAAAAAVFEGVWLLLPREDTLGGRRALPRLALGCRTGSGRRALDRRTGVSRRTAASAGVVSAAATSAGELEEICPAGVPDGGAEGEKGGGVRVRLTLLPSAENLLASPPVLRGTGLR